MSATPAIVLGGGAAAVSVARALGGQGIAVFGLGEAAAPLRWSRHCRWIRLPDDAEPEDWLDWLLEQAPESLRGAVLLPCSDDGLALLAVHHDALAGRYRLDRPMQPSRPALYRLAEAAGVPVPACWAPGSLAELVGLLPAMRFPVVVLRHGPHCRAEDAAELMQAMREALLRGEPMVVAEHIPGPDGASSAYDACLDDAGEPLFEFTSAAPRRRPLGAATYRVAGWLPETADLGLRLFRHLGLRGLGHAGFRRDDRDGRLKLIGFTPRFTDGNALLRCCGVDAAGAVYRRLAGEPLAAVRRQGGERRLMFPYEDAGGALLDRWDRLRRADCLPYFAWSDPGPSLAVAAARLGRLWGWDGMPQPASSPIISGR